MKVREKTKAELVREILELKQQLVSQQESCKIVQTDCQQAEIAFHESEIKYRQLAESSTAIVYRLLLKPELKFEYVSSAVTEITGYTPEDHYNDPQLWLKLVHPEDRILLENTTRFRTGEPLELRWVRKDGRIIWTEQRNIMLFDENGEPYAIDGNARDISDRKNIELALVKEAERNSLLLSLFTRAPGMTDNELYDEALSIAVKITDSKIGFFHQISDDQLEIILTSWNDEAKKNCTVRYDDHYPIDKAGNWADSVRQKKAVVYNDYLISPNKKGLPEGHAAVQRMLCIPVIYADKVRLIFGVGNKSSDYGDSDVIQIQAIAYELHKILEKRNIERNLKKIEDRWQFAIEGSNDGIWDWDMLTDEVFFSNRLKEMIGYGPDELDGRLSEWQSRIHPDDLEHVSFRLQQHINKESPVYSDEHRLLCRDGSWKWILDRGKILQWNTEGKPTRMVGTHTDISERKIAEQQIRESEVQYRNLANSGSALIWTSGTDKLCNYFNDTWLRFTGRTLEQEMGNGWAEGVHPDDFDYCLETYLSAFDKQMPFEMEYRLRHCSGEYRWLVDLGTPNFNSAGKFVGYIGHCFDISERKLIEDTQTFLLGCGLPGTGEDFFESLARYLSEKLSMEYVCIDRLEGGGLMAQTVAIYNNGGFETNVRYALKDTPCGEVVDRSVCCYRHGVRHLFPNDSALQELNAESYIGTTLLDSKGKAIGLIAIIGHHPLHDEGKAATVLKLIAPRAAGELERREAENALKETLEQLFRAKEKAEESDRLKSAFLANMSHEIRTPMNGILGFSELLKEPGLNSSQQQEYIRIIEKSGTRMLNIINDIVDISKIEAGLMKLDLQQSDINEQIGYICTFFKPEVEAKGMKLSFINPLPAQEAILITDREKVYAILTNLVKNAIKFSEKGTIEIGYEQQGDQFKFFVKDNGIGIPKQRQLAIFERFIQADIEDRAARQGAGLGLAITKTYVEMLGGKIWVESTEGAGSSFYFTLPQMNKSVSAPVVQQMGSSEKADGVRKLKILIAEDDEVSKILIDITIKMFGDEILKVRTGVEAVEICRNNPDIDLILMDVQMPEMSGYEATREIRKFNTQVIIIAQTAYGLSGDREKAIESGCNDYIAKPIFKEELIDLINKYFRK